MINMNKDDIKSRVSQVLKKSLASSSITIERAQEISVAFEDVYNQTIDPEDFKNLFVEFATKYPELRSLSNEIVLNKAAANNNVSSRNALQQIAGNK